MFLRSLAHVRGPYTAGSVARAGVRHQALTCRPLRAMRAARFGCLTRIGKDPRCAVDIIADFVLCTN